MTDSACARTTGVPARASARTARSMAGVYRAMSRCACACWTSDDASSRVWTSGWAFTTRRIGRAHPDLSTRVSPAGAGSGALAAVRLRRPCAADDMMAEALQETPGPRAPHLGPLIIQEHLTAVDDHVRRGVADDPRPA